MAKKRRDLDFHKLTASKGAEAWFYYSRSGKSIEIHVRPLDYHGNPMLSRPVTVKLNIKRISGKVVRTKK